MFLKFIHIDAGRGSASTLSADCAQLCENITTYLSIPLLMDFQVAFDFANKSDVGITLQTVSICKFTVPRSEVNRL